MTMNEIGQTGAGGYNCAVCQQYVLWGSLHVCPGYNLPTPINPIIPGLGPQEFPAPSRMPQYPVFPGSNQTWTAAPLTADEVRKIVREEIERRFPITAGPTTEKQP